MTGDEQVKILCDSLTDHEKLALAVSTGSVGWPFQWEALRCFYNSAHRKLGTTPNEHDLPAF